MTNGNMVEKWTASYTLAAYTLLTDTVGETLINVLVLHRQTCLLFDVW